MTVGDLRTLLTMLDRWPKKEQSNYIINWKDLTVIDRETKYSLHMSSQAVL